MEKKPFDHSFQFKDDLAVHETFVDGIHMTQVDGTTMRMTLTVARADPPKTGNKSPTGQKVVAVRLVMPLPAMAELYNQLDNLVRGLEQQGVLQREGGAARTVQ